MKKKNILVACDSLDYILIFKILDAFYVISRAESREEIMMLRKKQTYDLLLIDIAFLKPDFKVLDGITEKDIPVIALSSEPYDARNKELKEAGCCACYVKPIRHKMFAAFVEYWLNEYTDLKCR